MVSGWAKAGRWSAVAVLGAATLFTTAAQAIQQPDGTTIPVATSQLNDIFATQGETIDIQLDAADIPETFTPSCGLTFEVLGRYASYQNSFGWYNVTGQKPTLAEHYEFLACTDPVGTVKVLDIKNDPNYLGGDIGFYQAVGNCGTLQNHLHIVYSEKAYNPDAQQQNPYIHLLLYDSTVINNAFYFAWEDLLQGGDNDFSDLVTLVTGITCTGGGGSCQTGQLGICADGTLQCQSGDLGCVPNNEPGDEICNALDDDCDGDTDEGEICPGVEVCSEGTCIPPCGVEFPCPNGSTCDSSIGLCVDDDCLDVDCPTGEKCIEGECKAPCDGVVCPYGQVCRIGVCLDPCPAIECDDNQVCELGVCIDHCDCAGCDSDESCQPDGLCIPTACEGVTCPQGQHCDASGNCVDDCDGAVCPTGQICELGECIDAPTGSGGASSTSTFGVGAGGDGASSSNSGGAGGTTGSATGAGGAPLAPAEDAGGCGCRVIAEPSDDDGWPLALGLLALLGAAVGRRRLSRLQS